MITIFKIMPENPTDDWRNVQDQITVIDMLKASAVATRENKQELPKMWMTETMAATLLLGRN
jgi:hypothetical protein